MGCWWEGVDESRLLIAPDISSIPPFFFFLFIFLTREVESGFLLLEFSISFLFLADPGSNGDGSARLISLRHPKSDGSLYTATPIDPVFIMLPIFEKARMKKVDDPGKFRQLDEILFINDYPGYQHLFSIAENCMQVVCEIKEIGSSKFFRLDDMKVLAWLNYKVCQLKQTLPALDQNYAARDEKDTLADAVSIIGEYLKDEPWLKLLSNHFKLNLLEATGIASDFEACSNAIESPMGSCNPSQGKTTSEKKTARNQKQAKKAKIETESRNIKEMFSRASRRRN